MNARVVCVYSIYILSFCYIIVHNKMTSNSEYYNFILDDDDGDSSLDGGDQEYLDTQWITEYENQIVLSEYELFLKTDIVRVSFQFIYLDRDKKCVEFIVPMTGPYILQHANKISQNELLRIIHKYQNHSNKKYYNFQSLLLYDFHMPENDDNDVRWVSEYLSPPPSYSSSGSATMIDTETETDTVGDEYGRIVEYTNLLSFDTIYFHPLIAMFHDLIGFTVVLYED